MSENQLPAGRRGFLGEDCSYEKEKPDDLEQHDRILNICNRIYCRPAAMVVVTIIDACFRLCAEAPDVKL